MGQSQSVSQKRFEEDYYLFFDEKNARGKHKGVVAQSTAGVNHHIAGMATKDLVFTDLSDAKLMDYSINGDVFRASAHQDERYAKTPDSTTVDGSPRHDSVIPQHLTFNDEESGSDTECAFREYQSPTGRVISGYWNGEEFINGRIRWMDGREYNGSLKGSVPDGFGVYKTSVGKEYTGYWRRGLQHGEGSYVTEKDGCRITRRGLWDNGQLVHWLDDEDLTVGNLDTNRTVIEEIMATPTSSPIFTPSSIVTGSIASTAISPCVRQSILGGVGGT
ncbi:hypothetical protein BgAZ_205970 [Babesia gibsoni]|uniref:MORN repeat-containing protein n=1 Tax=Babesia gibsoni TaxID=33632 RepID=A0AAD8LQX2_BABGI|nr:hypothetical protein BgAZ_205970 [Babesia gibsoni]